MEKLCCTPSTAIRPGAGEPEHNGAYYKMDDMSHLRYDDIGDELIDNDYKLPCTYELCENLGTLQEAQKRFKEWNHFRRLLQVLARDLEIKQLRESKVPLAEE